MGVLAYALRYNLQHGIKFYGLEVSTMDCLSRQDVREIIEMLEDEVNCVPKLTAADKMKIRSKIRRQDNWLSGFKNPTTKAIVMKLNSRLSDVFRLYTYGFSKKLNETLDQKLARLYKLSAHSRPFMAACQGEADTAEALEERRAA